MFWYLTMRSGDSTTKLLLAVMVVTPSAPRPDLVTISTTPLEARDPYSAAALAPRSTVIDSMFEGSMSWAMLP